MALSYIGAGAGDGTTITIPAGHQPGDMIMIFAYRSATTAPSLPAGWTTIDSNSSGATSFRVGYKLAISSADTSGTWTNATGLVCQVLRGSATNKTPFGVASRGTGTGTTVTYSSQTLEGPGTSWLFGFGATKTTDSTLETAPAGMTNVATSVGALNEYAGHNTNGVYTSGSWPSTNVSVGGTSAEWRTVVVEVYAEQLGNIENYKFIKVGDGMSVSEKIR